MVCEIFSHNGRILAFTTALLSVYLQKCSICCANNKVQKQRGQFFIPLCRTLLLYAQWMMYTYIANIFCKIFAVNDMWASVTRSRWCHARPRWQQPGRLKLYLHWHHWHNHIDHQRTSRDNDRDFCIFKFYNDIQFSIIILYLLFHRTDI